ncbi:TolC family protein [Spirosoma knui]
MRGRVGIRWWLGIGWLLPGLVTASTGAAWTPAATSQTVVVSGQRQPDTTAFPAPVFFDIIRQHHPIVKQAALYNEEARQVLVQARGAFDPKLVSYYDRKEFGQDLYYNHWQNKLAVPLWVAGIDLNVSYDRNEGKYINPEERTPASGLTGIGLSVPVGQALFIDARRNAVRQARLAQDMAKADQLKLVNKTLFDAAKTYWDWYLAYQQRRWVTEGFELAERRFQALRERALIGDAAGIDTTEAFITVQDRLLQRQQAEIDEQNARLRVNNFLWDASARPVELPAQAIPEEPSLTLLTESTLQMLANQAARQHPELLKLDTKLGQLALEERFRKAMIQPQVSVTASLLSQTPTVDVPYDWSSYYAFRPQNHKIGVDFVFPLFLRKERGKLREVQIKNQQTELERQQTGRDISTTVQAAYNQLQALARQVALQQQTIQNQERLLQAEQQKFELGESSLFLVNARETKLIDLRLKGEELKTKYQKAIAELYFVAGTTQ